jgi:hypothetical protein
MYPASGKLVGDWKIGERLTHNGAGDRIKAGRLEKRKENGGLCQNWYGLAPGDINVGNIGPSLSGESIKNILEDVCDNLFNSDPYYPQGGDMVRIGGMRYTCNPTLKIGDRISNMTLAGQAIEAGKRYKIASWAPVGEGATGEPVWDVIVRCSRDKRGPGTPQPNRPTLVGVERNRGIG